MKKILLLATIVFLLTSARFVCADSEAGNRVYVKSSEHGSLYAKSVPDDMHGSVGQTLIYRVDNNDDVLVYTFDWYSPEIYLLSNGMSLVRLGSWPRGHESNKEDLAIAFYKDGKLLKEYSTWDISNLGYKAQRSVSHYTLFAERLGYRWMVSNDYAFDIKMHDSTILSFNITNGKILTKLDEDIAKLKVVVSNLKIKWHREFRENNYDDAGTYEITIKNLRSVSSGPLQDIPEGYQVIPGKLFEEVKVEKLNQ